MRFQVKNYRLYKYAIFTVFYEFNIFQREVMWNKLTNTSKRAYTTSWIDPNDSIFLLEVHKHRNSAIMVATIFANPCIKD